MRGVWRVAEIRAAEEALMREVPDGTLMRRAAAGLARRCALLLGRVYGAEVLLLAGAGNNGGDALYAGALLARRGARVTALLLDPDRAHRDGLADLRRAGGRVRTRWSDDLAADVVLDGIVGIGATGGLREPAATVVRALRARTPRPAMVAFDVPSGVGVDTGAVPDPGERVAGLVAALGASGAPIRLRHDQVGAGYGVLTAAAAAAMRTAARTEGLLLDPVYTGKALAGLAAAVGDGSIRPGERTVFVHTGGLPGLFGHTVAAGLAAGVLADPT